MKPDAREQQPAADMRAREAPAAARPARVQQALGVVVLLGLLGTVALWLANMHRAAYLAGIVTIGLAVVFLSGAGVARNRSGKGPSMPKFPQILPGRKAKPSASPQQQDLQTPGGLLQEDPSATQQDPLPPLQEYPSETQGRHRVTRHPPARQAGTVVAAARAWNVAPLPEPPVFVGPSTPGQAAWLLPVGATPSGLSADGIRLRDLEVRAASVVGAGHRCQEPAVARQDAYALGRTESGNFLVVAIADGVGQSRHSDLAARVAVSAATRELTRIAEASELPEIDTGLLYTKIAGEMVGTGRDRGIPDADVCAILITAVIPTRPQPNGTRRMWTSWIGDVSMWISRKGELRRCTGRDKTGLDRNALDAVLPFNPDQVEERVFELWPHDRVALMTDGVSDSLDSVAGARDYFARQWAGAPPHPAAFLHSLCYDGPGQTDDRTAVVVWCGGPGPGDRRALGEGR